MAEFKPFPHFGTQALHSGQEPEKWKSQAVVPPISMSTTFKQFGPGDHAVSPDIHCLSLSVTTHEDRQYDT